MLALTAVPPPLHFQQLWETVLAVSPAGSHNFLGELVLHSWLPSFAVALAGLWMTLWESDHSILQSWPCRALSMCMLLCGAWEKPENQGRSPAQLFTSTE